MPGQLFSDRICVCCVNGCEEGVCIYMCIYMYVYIWADNNEFYPLIYLFIKNKTKKQNKTMPVFTASLIVTDFNASLWNCLSIVDN